MVQHPYPPTNQCLIIIQQNSIMPIERQFIHLESSYKVSLRYRNLIANILQALSPCLLNFHCGA